MPWGNMNPSPQSATRLPPLTSLPATLHLETRWYLTLALDVAWVLTSNKPRRRTQPEQRPSDNRTGIMNFMRSPYRYLMMTLPAVLVIPFLLSVRTVVPNVVDPVPPLLGGAQDPRMAYTVPGSFTIFANVSGSGDLVVSYPFGPAIQKFVAGGGIAFPARIGASARLLGEPNDFVITRVAAWHEGASGSNYIMVGKLDVVGFGGDYLTPTIAYGSEKADSGWFPKELRPLFLPGDELHIHVTGAGVAFATIYVLVKP